MATGLTWPPRVGRRGLTVAALCCVLLTLLTAASARGASLYAPVNRPGPRLDVSAARLAASLRCSTNLRGARREPILLVPGTDLAPAPNFAWNYERAFHALRFPYCTVTLPNNATTDIQVAGEYVVHAIRQMHRASRRKVQIVGFSQGGMVPRWALRFWPDTRAMVDDDIGLDASNHGTLSADYCSATIRCPAAYWQQRNIARFIAALNSRQETFRGISYTEIYSNKDEVVTPNSGPGTSSSSVHGGGGRIRNVMVQSICPADTSDHLAMGSYDAVGYALVLDGLTHAGPANPARISPRVCTEPYMPGVNPATFAADYAGYLAYIASSASHSHYIAAEPPLRCYVFAFPRGSCARQPTPRFTG